VTGQYNVRGMRWNIPRECEKPKKPGKAVLPTVFLRKKTRSTPWCVGGRQHHPHKAPFKNKTYQSIRIRYGEHARERKSRGEPLTSTKVTADSDHFLFRQQRGAILRCIRSSTISTPSSCTCYKNAFPGYFVPELVLRGSFNHDTYHNI
jgi:hypothetical protein